MFDRLRKIYCSFFFFQAEDGIRDTSVTGVQTCALPIYYPKALELYQEALKIKIKIYGESHPDVVSVKMNMANVRSEERRVGKECRSRRWAEHEKKKKNEIRELSTGYSRRAPST